MDKIEKYQKKIQRRIKRLKKEQELLEKKHAFAGRLKVNREFMDSQGDAQRRLNFLREGCLSVSDSYEITGNRAILNDPVYQRSKEYKKTHKGGLGSLMGALKGRADDLSEKIIKREMQEKEYNFLLNCADEEFNDYMLMLTKELIRSSPRPFSYIPGWRGIIESAQYSRGCAPSL